MGKRIITGDFGKDFNSLPTRQRAFAQYLCDGMNYKDAYLAAGYMQDRDFTDPKNQQRARASASKLARNKIIKKYVDANRCLVTAEAMTVETVIHRVALIMNGELFCNVVTKKGEVVSCPPSFRDQVNAARLVFDILKFQQENHKQHKGELIGELDESFRKRTAQLIATEVEEVIEE